MCGISAIISLKDENILDLILSSIEELENRGYDAIIFVLSVFKFLPLINDHGQKLNTYYVELMLPTGSLGCGV